jgi:type III secretory pathway lipoprotein EscJ
MASPKIVDMPIVIVIEAIKNLIHQQVPSHSYQAIKGILDQLEYAKLKALGAE